jgi:predicted dehydrogenase
MDYSLKPNMTMGNRKTHRPATCRRKTIRFGVIGAGGMGRLHAEGLAKVARAKLTAICDADAASAGQAGRDFSVAFFTDHRQLIRSGLCDAVIIATPHPLHAPVAIDCMRAGLHVISEKPLSERISNAERMAQAAKDNRVAFAMVFQRRFDPLSVKAVELVRSGRIGKIHRTMLLCPDYRTQAYYDGGAWRGTWRGEGGGVMLNQAPHLIDLYVQLCGTPCEVFGRTETRLHMIEVEDFAEALLNYPDGGSGYLYCSTCEPRQGQRIEVFGDRGKLILDDSGLTLFSYRPGIREHMRKAKVIWGEMQTVKEKIKAPGKKTKTLRIPENMVAHLLDGAPLLSSGESGLASLELANAITLSAHTGKWVKLPISRKRYDALLDKLCRESTFAKKKVKSRRMTDPRIAK